MSAARKVLVIGGLALAIWGMLYGLWFALFQEQTILAAMGQSLSTGFIQAAERDLDASHTAIGRYAAVRFGYIRQVDAHSHWTGLAMLLVLVGAAFDRVAFSERVRTLLAWGLLAGSVIFPLGVLLQTSFTGWLSNGLAILGVVLVTAALGLVVLGFLREKVQPVS